MPSYLSPSLSVSLSLCLSVSLCLCSGMLKKLEVLSEQDVEPFVKLFETMDRDHSGLLTAADLDAASQQTPQSASTKGNRKDVELDEINVALSKQSKPPEVVRVDAAMAKATRRSSAYASAVDGGSGAAHSTPSRGRAARLEEEQRKFEEMKQNHVRKSCSIALGSSGSLSSPD